MSLLDASKKALRYLSLMGGGGKQKGDAQHSQGPDRLAFGTIVRSAPLEAGGELVVLNWNEKTVEEKVPVVPQDPDIIDDPNPRGNTRGCRGIRWHGDQMIAASYHTLRLYDEELRSVGALSDGLMVGLHEIATTADDTVWVTSTAIDAVIEYDLTEQTRRRAYWPREMEAFQEQLGLVPLSIDKAADNRLNFLAPAKTDSDSHLHLNAVEEHAGDVYALSNAYGAILNLTTSEVVLRHEGLEGAHNLLILDEDVAIVNDTFGGVVRFYDLAERELHRSIDLTDYRWVRELIRWKIPPYLAKEVARTVGLREHSVAKPLFVRGLVRDESHLFVGVSPAAILQIDWQTGELVDAYQYADNVHVCVHGLEVLG